MKLNFTILSIFILSFTAICKSNNYTSTFDTEKFTKIKPVQKFVIEENNGLTQVYRNDDNKKELFISVPSEGFQWLNKNLFHMEDMHLSVLFGFKYLDQDYITVQLSAGGDSSVHLLKGSYYQNKYLSSIDLHNFPYNNQVLENEVLQTMYLSRYEIKNNILFLTGDFSLSTLDITKSFSLESFKEVKRSSYSLNFKTKALKDINVYETRYLKEKITTLNINSNATVLNLIFINEEKNPTIFILKIKTESGQVGYISPELGYLDNNLEGIHTTAW